MEMNPGTLTAKKLWAYRQSGVNRVSLGLQSARDKELRHLGRIHTWAQFLESYYLCREAGICNLSVDLMSALPGQTYASWLDTLQKVAELSPEHISAYSLIVEEGTPFYDLYGENVSQPASEWGRGVALPDEETERAMYQATKEVLAHYGYERYEISNYARPGRRCAHNCVYWTRGDYLGLGLGAASMVDNVRWSNERGLWDYLEEEPGGHRRDIHALTLKEQMEETMFLGLRMMQGVGEEGFVRAFGRSLEEVYGDVIERYERLGLLRHERGRVFLTDGGIDVSNRVLADFLFP